MRRDGKLLIAMVGLPARGKTYIAKRIKRHLDWLGIHTQMFNAGNYRRQGKCVVHTRNCMYSYCKLHNKLLYTLSGLHASYCAMHH
jgi:6-phosphofructo-2-kinase